MIGSIITDLANFAAFLYPSLAASSNERESV